MRDQASGMNHNPRPRDTVSTCLLQLANNCCCGAGLNKQFSMGPQFACAYLRQLPLNLPDHFQSILFFPPFFHI